MQYNTITITIQYKYAKEYNIIQFHSIQYKAKIIHYNEIPQFNTLLPLCLSICLSIYHNLIPYYQSIFPSIYPSECLHFVKAVPDYETVCVCVCTQPKCWFSLFLCQFFIHCGIKTGWEGGKEKEGGGGRKGCGKDLINKTAKLFDDVS